jgi:ABC-type oligopeptide transport system substrate-binding subunit
MLLICGRRFLHILFACLFLALPLGAVASPDLPDAPLSFLDEQDGTGGGPFAVSPSADGYLRLVGPVQLTSLDPGLVRDLGHMFLIRQIFAGLVRFDDDLQPIPAIASSWEISDDGLVYTFHLDENARFWSGRQIVAEDILFSLTRAFDPSIADGVVSALSAPTFLADIAGAGEMLSGRAESLAGVVAIDERTVEIRLEQPRSTFLMRLASPPASIVDSGDMSLGEEWWMSPNASGPFAIASWANSTITLEPNEHYVLGQPAVKGVQVRIGDAAFGGLNLYETGQIDLVGVDWQNIERIADPANSMSGELTITPLFATEYIAFRTDVAPFDDPKIREALQVAFPADRVASVSLNSRVGAAFGVVPDGMLGVEAWATTREADIGLARQLIGESSYGAPENVPAITIYASAPQRAESFRDSLAASLGLHIDVVAVDWVSYLDGLQNREYPAYLLYWGADYPDPESFLLSLFGSGASDNYVDYQNPEFDALMSRAALEVDPDARVAIYREANQMLLDDAVVVPLYHDVAYTLMRPYVQNLAMTPLGLLYLDRVTIAGS